jgi:hypothetical protein
VVLLQQRVPHHGCALSEVTSCALPVQRRTNQAHTQTLKKKALQARQQIRNSLRMCPHVLFFGAIRYARCSPRASVKRLEE